MVRITQATYPAPCPAWVILQPAVSIIAGTMRRLWSSEGWVLDRGFMKILAKIMDKTSEIRIPPPEALYTPRQYRVKR